MGNIFYLRINLGHTRLPTVNYAEGGTLLLQLLSLTRGSASVIISRYDTEP